MFKKIVVIIFFALSIRTSAYSLDLLGMEDLYEFDKHIIIYSNEREDGIMSFLLKKDGARSPAKLYLCKIDNSKLTPIHLGCFPFPLEERD